MPVMTQSVEKLMKSAEWRLSIPRGGRLRRTNSRRVDNRVGNAGKTAQIWNAERRRAPPRLPASASAAAGPVSFTSV